MSLYPSLEDMKVDQIIQNQQHFQNFNNGQSASAIMPQGLPSPSDNQAALYPNIMEYMGLSLTPELLKYNQVALPTPSQVAIRTTQSNQMQVAPVTGNDPGLMRAEVKQGIRQVVLCKDQNGKIGLKLQSVNKGVFVSFVERNSAASLAGLRFGDQILQINEQTVAGWDNDKVSKFIKKADPGRITMAVRDRPFERTVTLQKDSLGTLGFMFKDNKITSIVKDSSAARNGILINHHMVEIDGRNVVGLKEKEVKEIVDSTGRTVTVTIIPTFIFEHIMKSIGWGLVKKKMDHSIPEL